MAYRFRVHFEVWQGALLTALGLGATASCAGKSQYTEDGPRDAGGASPVASGGSGGAASGRAGTGGGTSGSAGTTVNAFPCENPQPILDAPSGFVKCADGSIHREQVLDCPVLLPRENEVPDYDPSFDDCQQDEECTALPYGHCSYKALGNGVRYTCHYGCVRDEDCSAGHVCQCGDPIGECVTATCVSDADCLPGFHCTVSDTSGGCAEMQFSCQTPQDECLVSCTTAANCVPVEPGVRKCVGMSCDIGRPFVIEGKPRTAERRSRAWDATSCPVLETPEDLAARAELAEHWTRAGLAEHASIAAFARFSLELLALGAPPELLDRTAAAMRDEIAHAQACFGFASAYGGRPVGPGSLEVNGALPTNVTLESAVLSTFAEGCVGETLAALEAAESAAHASDPVVAGMLARVAEDESRHAELAFRFVQWALHGAAPALFGRVRRVLEATRVELARAVGDRRAHAAARDLTEHGVLGAAHRAALQLRAFDEVVAPAMALLLRAPERATAQARAMSATSSA